MHKETGSMKSEQQRQATQMNGALPQPSPRRRTNRPKIAAVLALGLLAAAIAVALNYSNPSQQAEISPTVDSPAKPLPTAHPPVAPPPAQPNLDGGSAKTSGDPTGTNSRPQKNIVRLGRPVADPVEVEKLKIKTTARSAARLFAFASKFSAEDLSSIQSLDEALKALEGGISGEGEHVFQLPEVTEEIRTDVEELLRFEDGQIITTQAADLTESDLALMRKLYACDHAGCNNGVCTEASLADAGSEDS